MTYDTRNLARGMRGEDVAVMQKALALRLRTRIVADGDFGPGTEGFVKAFQRDNRFYESGVFGRDEWNAMRSLIDQKILIPSDVEEVARRIGVQPSTLKAFLEVEGKGEGFLPDGRPLILFERHKFYQNIKAKFGQSKADMLSGQYPNICHPVWDASAYKGYAREFDRLAIAKNIDNQCALLSASWGVMQVMGFNHKLCGHATVDSFVAAMERSEDDQFAIGIQFITNQPALLNALRSKDYHTMARIYNGTSYATHNYHGRLQAADDKFARGVTV